MQAYAMISLSFLNTWLLLYKEINSYFIPQDILKRAQGEKQRDPQFEKTFWSLQRL